MIPSKIVPLRVAEDVLDALEALPRRQRPGLARALRLAVAHLERGASAEELGALVAFGGPETHVILAQLATFEAPVLEALLLTARFVIATIEDNVPRAVALGSALNEIPESTLDALRAIDTQMQALLIEVAASAGDAA